MKQKLQILILVLTLPLCAQAQTEVYKVVPEESKIFVDVESAGVFGFLGHPHHIRVPDFSGEVVAAENETASVNLTVKSSSLLEEGKFNEKDKQTIETRMHENVLESATYPEIRFESTDVNLRKTGDNSYKADILGELSLHGMTRKVVIPVAVTLGDGSLRVIGKFILDRDHFRIKAESAGGGTVKVDDKLKVSFDLIARK